MKGMVMQQAHERALDRRLSRLADPVIPPALVARMIAEIPQMPQLQPEGRAIDLDPRGSPESIMAVMAANTASEDFGRRAGWASLVAGLAACFVAVLLLSLSRVDHGAAPARAAARGPAVSSPPVPPITLAADLPPARTEAPAPRKPLAASRRLAKPAVPSSADAPAAQPQFAAEQAPSAAPIAIAAPNDRIAIAPVAGPPAPRGVNDEIGSDDGTAIPAPGTMGPRAPTGMGFGGGMGSDGGDTQSYPGRRR